MYTIDDDCFVATDPGSGRPIDVMAGHLRNLLTPSTPYFFNTLYDPFAQDADFVACYPFGLRAGVPTAMSHGMWLNVPDYDGPTQLGIEASAKPAAVSMRHVDAVITIPRGTLFPCCGMNLAFDRLAVGPCMYFGIMGAGYPWGRYEDMWAGWCTKVIADHLGLGVKTGKPYVFHSKASDPYANWTVEVAGIDWQEEIIPFFAALRLSEESDTVVKAYRELAGHVRAQLTRLDPYFNTLADGAHAGAARQAGHARARADSGRLYTCMRHRSLQACWRGWTRGRSATRGTRCGRRGPHDARALLLRLCCPGAHAHAHTPLPATAGLCQDGAGVARQGVTRCTRGRLNNPELTHARAAHCVCRVRRARCPMCGAPPLRQRVRRASRAPPPRGRAARTS